MLSCGSHRSTKVHKVATFHEGSVHAVIIQESTSFSKLNKGTLIIEGYLCPGGTDANDS